MLETHVWEMEAVLSRFPLNKRKRVGTVSVESKRRIPLCLENLIWEK